MGPCAYRFFDPLFAPAEAEAMVDLCERFGRYGMYSQEAAEVKIGVGVAERHDAVMNFIRTGGRLGKSGADEDLVARTNYFRESYAYGERVAIGGIEPFLHHEGFMQAAREIHERPVIEPAIAYANVLLPGQELAVHTDVPEFRGANRTRFPQWLMVVMHHSGLFDDWRMPIATGVSWFGRCDGGEFVFYPEGTEGPPVVLPARHNTAILVDTDSVFHGVDLVAPGVSVAPLRPGMSLDFEGDGRWSVHSGEETVASYGWDEIRFSISWKAYCFGDEAERRIWSEHADDLELDFILDRLEGDLRRRDRLAGPRPAETDFALLLIEEYIRFPPAAEGS